MSAKHPRKGANKPPAPKAAPAPGPAVESTPNLSSAGAATLPAADVSWLESSDPRKRMWGKIIFAGIWVYVAALWLLALDQTFHWGIFGPKIPPVP